MSHGDQVQDLPDDFNLIASTATAAIAATAATSAIVAKPLGDYVLKLIKPTVKKVVKKVKAILGKKPRPESVAERVKFQRSLRK